MLLAVLLTLLILPLCSGFLFGGGGGGGGGGNCNCGAQRVQACPPPPACAPPPPQACPPPPIQQQCDGGQSVQSYASSPPVFNIPQQPPAPAFFPQALPPPPPPSYAIPRILQPPPIQRPIIATPSPPLSAPPPRTAGITKTKKPSTNSDEYDEDTSSASTSSESSAEKPDSSTYETATKSKEKKEGAGHVYDAKPTVIDDAASEQVVEKRGGDKPPGLMSSTGSSVNGGGGGSSRPANALAAEELQDVYDDMSPVLESENEALVSTLAAAELPGMMDDDFVDSINKLDDKKDSTDITADAQLLEVHASKKMEISPPSQRPYKMAGVPQNEAIRDAKCNSPALRRIMVENIVNSPTISKQLIYSAARYEYRRSIDVICARNSFSYVAVTSPVFCELTKGPITCFAFFQPSR